MPQIPNGIVYKIASPDKNEKAKNWLRNIFNAEHLQLSKLVTDSSDPIMLGGFLSSDLIQNYDVDVSQFIKIDNHIRLSEDVIPVMTGLFAKTATQKSKLGEILQNYFTLSKNIEVRKLTPEELQLIWFFIGWDIEEPIFVVADGQQKFVFDISPSSGDIFWLENITSPCFQLGFEDKRLPCLCSNIISEENDYQVVFKQQKDCKEEQKTSYHNPFDGKDYTANWQTYGNENSGNITPIEKIIPKYK